MLLIIDFDSIMKMFVINTKRYKTKKERERELCRVNAFKVDSIEKEKLFWIGNGLHLNFHKLTAFHVNCSHEYYLIAREMLTAWQIVLDVVIVFFSSPLLSFWICWTWYRVRKIPLNAINWRWILSASFDSISDFSYREQNETKINGIIYDHFFLFAWIRIEKKTKKEKKKFMLALCLRHTIEVEKPDLLPSPT